MTHQKKFTEKIHVDYDQTPNPENSTYIIGSSNELEKEEIFIHSPGNIMDINSNLNFNL